MNETKLLVPQTEQRFTETVTEILKSAGFTTKAEPKACQEFQMVRVLRLGSFLHHLYQRNGVLSSSFPQVARIGATVAGFWEEG